MSSANYPGLPDLLSQDQPGEPRLVWGNAILLQHSIEFIFRMLAYDALVELLQGLRGSIVLDHAADPIMWAPCLLVLPLAM